MSTTITPTTTATSADAAAAPTGKKPTDALGRDAFLNLLVTQLEHQDPTAPQADGEFIAQLAQFSSLEQLQNINTTLSQISHFFSAVQPAAAASSSTSSSSSTGRSV